MPVTWVAGKTLVSAPTATSLAVTTPAGIADGDTLVAAVAASGTITGPSGWTQRVVTANYTNGSWTHRTAVFTKDTVTSANSSTSYTWQRSGSAGPFNALSVTYAVLRGVDALAASSSAVQSSVNSWSATPPELTASADGQMLLMFGATVNIDGNQTVTAPAGSTKFSGGALDTYVLAGAYQARDNGQANSGSFNMAPTGGPTTNGLGAVTLRFSAAGPGTVSGYVSAAGPLGAPLMLGVFGRAGWVACPGPLGAARVRGFHDFSAQVANLSPRYAMDLTTPGGAVRAPISSWQATLQTDGQNYVQAVVPACEPYVDAINAATLFTVYRTGEVSGLAISYEMAAAAPTFLQLSQGPNRYTALISGYSPAFAADAGLPSSLDRTLVDVRSVFSEPTGLRIRCAVDWLLRPGMRAVYGATTFDVGAVNYYVAEGDQYMDVQEAEAV